MQDYFNANYLRDLYKDSKDHLLFKPLAEWTLGQIEIQCFEAAKKSCLDIELNLRETYNKLHPEFFSRHEYDIYKYYILDNLLKRNLKCVLSDDTLTINWV